MISIVIPIYNEEEILSANSDYFKRLARQGELIFVDGGSVDRSIEIARGYGEVLCSQKGRALQMNYGANFARGEILLFLHADTFISQDVLTSIKARVMDDGFIGGCLTQRIDKGGLIYRCIENFGNTRARITRVFYGDQGIFVKKDIFLKMGGFPEVPIMEDILFTKKLRRWGKTLVLPDKILASSRRWKKRGVIRTILLYSTLNILLWLRVSLKKIKRFCGDLR